MGIVGLGIDLVAVHRVARLLDEHGERFLSRVFTQGEQQYASDARRYPEHLAARFAAKEAAFKALGVGWSGGVAWTDVETLRLPSGQPVLRTTGAIADIARRKGVSDYLVSLSHTEDTAMACVLALAGSTPAAVAAS